MATLKIHSGGQERAVNIPTLATAFSIGREEGNDLQLAEGKASRKHCALVRSGSDWVLKDLGSSNGTKIGGEKIAEVKLKHGMVFTIGATRLIFEDAVSAPPGVQKASPPGTPMPKMRGGKLARREDLFVEVLDGIRDRFISIDDATKVITVGRGEGNDIQIDEVKSSRNHCKLEKMGDEFVLVDLKSTNGTCVNGERVSQQALNWGDEITIGKTKIIVGNKKTAEDEECIPTSFNLDEGKVDFKLTFGPDQDFDFG
ncbi:MAG: FHA domain-containing protein [Planctomycetes bacterium]|nr:FHA domain-containing protein [Planctomycetota bacterium]